MAKHYGATVIAAASPSKHETVRALGADHVLDSRSDDLAAEVLRPDRRRRRRPGARVGGGDTFSASLAAARRVTGRVVVYGVAGGEAAITNWELVYKHQVHVIGLNIGVLIGAAPQLFGELMGELSALIAAGVLSPARPTAVRPGRRPEGPRGPGSARHHRQAGSETLTGGDARPVRRRDRAVPPGAAGALLPHGRLSA